jgi:hypothetical protein
LLISDDYPGVINRNVCDAVGPVDHLDCPVNDHVTGFFPHLPKLDDARRRFRRATLLQSLQAV